MSKPVELKFPYEFELSESSLENTMFDLDRDFDFPEFNLFVGNVPISAKILNTSVYKGGEIYTRIQITRPLPAGFYKLVVYVHDEFDNLKPFRG